jgi:NAD+ kinase
MRSATGKPNQTFGLVLHPTKPVGDSIATITAWAGTYPARVIARERDRDRVTPDVDTLPDDRFVAGVDGLIAVGGDGTMLGAMRLVVERPVPILGVNHGSLGFLVEVTPQTLENALEQMVAGAYIIEPRGCLVAQTADVELRTRFGFNDVVLARAGRSGAASIDLTVNDQQYGYYKCDALVVSTPSGSTAYNYAAGGPVLSPSVSAIVITPVAPMAGISRPVVLADGDRLTLRVAADSARLAVDVDGTASGELPPGAVLTTRWRGQAAQVVRLSPGAYARRSSVKLSLLDLPLRPDQLLDLVPKELRRDQSDASGADN